MLRTRWSRIACTALLLATMAAPAMAAVLQTGVIVFNLPSIDSKGNPNTDVPGKGQGKLYKETITGALFGVGAGAVLNKSGKAVTIVNQGLSMYDPWANKNVKSTSDQEIVSAPTGIVSTATLVIAYNPAAQLP